MTRRILPIIVAATAVIAACGGSDDEATDTADSSASSDTTAVDGDDDAAPSTEAAPDEGDAADAATELPMFASDFDRLCTTQVGFGGAAPLSDGAGPRPVVLLQETDSGLLIEASAELPAGWAIETDADFEDNSDLAPTELVGCAQVAGTSATGIQCDLELDDGSIATLELVDVTYELTVYGAATGEVVGTDTIEASDTDCPFFVFIDEGQTEYYNTPDADQYTAALESYVTPG